MLACSVYFFRPQRRQSFKKTCLIQPSFVGPLQCPQRSSCQPGHCTPGGRGLHEHRVPLRHRCTAFQSCQVHMHPTRGRSKKIYSVPDAKRAQRALLAVLSMTGVNPLLLFWCCVLQKCSVEHGKVPVVSQDSHGADRARR
jgi:hypothetical protein